MITLNEALAKYGVEKINSLTKYPSILTYHELADKGSLAPSLSESKGFDADETCFVTEKIDGTNSRIVVWGNDYLIGSREQFLYAKGDRFGDPALNITNTIKSIAEDICSKSLYKDAVLIIFGETYGGNVTAASKHYTSDKSFSYRLFDIVILEKEELNNILCQPIEKISLWRENKGQNFLSVDKTKAFATEHALETVPYLEILQGKDFPVSLSQVYDWLQKYRTTVAGINNSGHAEGVVVRTNTRSLIRKIRFEDYEKTKRKNGF